MKIRPAAFSRYRPAGMNAVTSRLAWARLAMAVACGACGGGGAAIVDARVDTSSGDGGADELDAAVDAATDGGADDAATDAAAIDADPMDTPATDAAAIDAAATDAAAIDAPAIDAGPLDAATPATLLGPTPYRSALDSPLVGAPGLVTVFLEDFEDGPVITSPGVTASSTTPSSSFGTGLIDSVDLDDDVLDGICQAGCDALFAFGQVDFVFDGTGLGGLPTHAGIVWTDGGVGATITFAAFDAAGTVLAETTVAGIPDDNYNGGTAEDRFFGVIAPAGVARIRISNSSGGIEVDHLQWGR